jgi:hypothetical protein
MSIDKIPALVKKYADARDATVAKGKEYDVIKAAEEALKTELMEVMTEEGVRGLDVEDVGRASLVVKVWLSVNVADKPTVYAYIREVGAEGLFKEEINSKTLTAWLDEHFALLMQKGVDDGLDPVDARNKALEFIKSKGAQYFTERNISLRRK